MMREMMVAASVLAASACGAVEPADTAMDPDLYAGSGSPVGGSDGGVGSGSGADPQKGCSKASECGPQMMCDLATSACVTPTLTMSSAEFLVEGSSWWTFDLTPTVRGTYSGPAGAVVSLVVDGVSIVVTHSQSNSWSAEIPQGVVTATGSVFTASLTDPSGGALELEQRVVLDGASPHIVQTGSVIYDERNDFVDFRIGKPVHTHNGLLTNLAVGACPDVYKYGYLMATSSAGMQNNPNPLTWNISIDDAQLDSSSPMYRVRTHGAVVLDWRPLPQQLNGSYTIELTQFVLPLIATLEGEYFIDVRAADRGNRLAEQTICWAHHLIPAPLEFWALSVDDELATISLPGDSAFARAINSYGHAPIGLARQHIVQYTNEPATIHWSGGVSRVEYSKTIFDDWVVETLPGASTMCPAGNTKPECRVGWEPAHYAGMNTYSGVVDLALNPLSVVVIDTKTGQTIASSNNTLDITFTVPGLAAGESPRGYNLIVRVPHLAWLQPANISGTQFAEYTLLGKQYTGDAAADVGVGCTNLWQSAFGTACQYVNYYKRFTAVDQARLDLVGFGVDIEHNGTTATYVPYSYRFADLSWSSGNDDLPGPN